MCRAWMEQSTYCMTTGRSVCNRHQTGVVCMPRSASHRLYCFAAHVSLWISWPSWTNRVAAHVSLWISRSSWDNRVAFNFQLWVIFFHHLSMFRARSVRRENISAQCSISVDCNFLIYTGIWVSQHRPHLIHHTHHHHHHPHTLSDGGPMQ